MNAALRLLAPAGLLLLLVACPPATAALAAQEPASRAEVGLPEKSEMTAAFYEYLLPALGHAYAGDWQRGVPPALVSLAGAGLALHGLEACFSETSCGILGFGLAVAFAGRLWGISSAIQTTRAYNQRIHAQPQITWGLAP